MYWSKLAISDMVGVRSVGFGARMIEEGAGTSRLRVLGEAALPPQSYAQNSREYLDIYQT